MLYLTVCCCQALIVNRKSSLSLSFVVEVAVVVSSRVSNQVSKSCRSRSCIDVSKLQIVTL